MTHKQVGIPNPHIKKLPDDATEHETGDFVAVTIPVDGFEKLIVFHGPAGSWVHKDYRVAPKKSKKKGKKRG
jgi:hypothetical protein